MEPVDWDSFDDILPSMEQMEGYKFPRFHINESEKGDNQITKTVKRKRESIRRKRESDLIVSIWSRICAINKWSKKQPSRINVLEQALICLQQIKKKS